MHKRFKSLTRKHSMLQSHDELEELHCADLIEHVNTYGVDGKSIEGHRFLDLHWKIIERYDMSNFCFNFHFVG